MSIRRDEFYKILKQLTTKKLSLFNICLSYFLCANFAYMFSNLLLFNTSISIYYLFSTFYTFYIGFLIQLEEECKIADICRHDQVPICGIDSCGEMRTFIDNCDMHEFNCDSKKGKYDFE